MKITAVEIARLRGIPAGWPALSIGDKGLIVYGPNGVGKSSIIDAIEATLTGRSTLFAVDRTGVNWESAAVHLKGGPPTVRIQGVLDGKTHELNFGGESDLELRDWMRAAQAASFVLRRYMLLRFIEAQPRSRYEQIEPFLNLERYADFEIGLKEIVRGLETRFNIANGNALAKAQVIRQTFGLEKDAPLKRADLIQRLLSRLKSSGLSADSEIVDLERIAEIISVELGGEKSSKRLATLGAVRHSAQQLTSATLIEPLYKQTVVAADELAAELRSSAQKVPVHLLTHALEHISVTTEDSCPICEQSIDRASLMARLASRIEEDRAVQLASVTLQARLEALKKASGAAAQAYKNFVAGWENAELGLLPPSYSSALKLFEALGGLTSATIGVRKDELDSSFGAAMCEPNNEVARVDEAIVSVGGGDRRASLIEAATFTTSLRDDVKDFEALWTSAADIAQQKRAADKLHEHAEAARKAAVQGIVDRVAKQANSFYEEIHPGENIATSKLIVRPATSSSILLSAAFHGRESPPMQYYSESHLDTLGLCYFLAIRKMEVSSLPDFRLLLVDDVLHSVDADHRVRLAHLLRKHFDDHQLVLVTHDKHFYDRLRAILGSSYKYLSITNWDIDEGPRLSDPSTDFDRVLDPSARSGRSSEDLAAAGGRFFEWLLKELTERLQVAIQARFSREHDIGSMWPSLAKKLRQHKGFTAAHPRLIEELNDNAWVRNKIGAHDNEVESPVTPKEVTAFVDKLASLYHAVACEVCNSLIQPSKAGALRCECSKLQYGP